MGCVIYEIVALKPPFRADTMEGLFKKVQSGKFPRIAPTFSTDLANLIRACLQVPPHQRPDCDKILSMASVHKRAVAFFPESIASDQYENVLLRTIKVPRNLMYVTEQLPSSTYDLKNVKSKADEDKIQKRNTAYIDKVFHRAKLYQPV